MSKEKKEKVIKVENLVIHAKNVDFIRERHRERETHERDPWEFLLGRPRPVHTEEESSSGGKTD
ncbi:MAG TPA: hypothetical protein DEO65_16365 [Bacillus bacterium]|uniref:Uncharacterized protein n=1 Tax=Siminovitchia fordii TaxID=254759 RepID=A0ABQ4K1N9_9BACI|nr:hypothetical protein [Siminovitchia fordii]GIN19684.1 hypothetical protein J1TS3_08180 [Siminovitchia fordii]HBZ11412.1 hypothetical protein [Bacillus sp. (in: firmicutes)]